VPIVERLLVLMVTVVALLVDMEQPRLLIRATTEVL
jgi:hypothetical protein